MRRFGDALVQALLALSVAGITVLLLAEVVLRYVLRLPLAGVDEAANFLFVWMAMLGAAVAVQRKAHVMSSLLLDRLTPRRQRAVRIFGLFVTAAFGAFLAATGLQDALLNMHQRMLVSGLPHGWLVMAIPAGGALMTLYAVVRAVEELRGAAEPASEHAAFLGG